jgi:hypothetical protein
MEKAMKRLFMAAAAALTLLLGGCATTVRSDVTTFHQWPVQMEDKSYAFEAPAPQEDTLELRSYQDLVRGQLARLGFHDAGAARPALLVSMHFTTTDVPVRVIEPMYPMTYYPSARFAFMGPRRHYWGSFYSPFYDPFWDPFPAYHVEIRHQYQRELQVGIKSAADGKRLFDVTVHNASGELSTPKMMPALVQSAFEGFPGPSGVARRVVLEEKKG